MLIVNQINFLITFIFLVNPAINFAQSVLPKHKMIVGSAILDINSLITNAVDVTVDLRMESNKNVVFNLR